MKLALILTPLHSTPRTLTSQALHEGVIGMCEGEKRKVTAPANLAYGEMASYNVHNDIWIPPNATIMYEIEMMLLSDKDDQVRFFIQ